jgi:hypothetical protein
VPRMVAPERFGVESGIGESGSGVFRNGGPSRFGNRRESSQGMFAGREAGAPPAARGWGLRNGLKSPKSDAAAHGTQGRPFAVSPTSDDYTTHRNVLTA